MRGDWASRQDRHARAHGPGYASAMFQLWLFLHILGAIVAFGFGFYAPIYGAMAA